MFDDEGFSLADINETLVSSERLKPDLIDDVYFIDAEVEAARKRERAAKKEKKAGIPADMPRDEEVDLNQAWVRKWAAS